MVSREILIGAAVVAMVVTLPFAMEAFSAINGRACGAGVTEICYPWGAEGPAAESWRYSSKATYLFAGLLPTILTVIAIATAAFTADSTLSKRRQWIAISLTILGLALLLA